MKSIEFEYRGIEELGEALKKAQTVLPVYAEDALDKEAQAAKEQIQQAYTKNVLKRKSKEWEKSSKKKKKKSLLKSFKKGKPMQKGINLTNAVVTTAPHYHLVEDGHEASGWYAKAQGAKPIKGKKIVATIMGRRKRDSYKIAERVLAKTLKGAGLDDYNG